MTTGWHDYEYVTFHLHRGERRRSKQLGAGRAPRDDRAANGEVIVGCRGG